MSTDPQSFKIRVNAFYRVVVGKSGPIGDRSQALRFLGNLEAEASGTAGELTERLAQCRAVLDRIFVGDTI